MAQTLPKGSIPRTKSARDQFWLNHLRALHEQDQPLSAYAQAHGLSPGSLYRARTRLRGRALVSEPELNAHRQPRGDRFGVAPRRRRRTRLASVTTLPPAGWEPSGAQFVCGSGPRRTESVRFCAMAQKPRKSTEREYPLNC